MKTRWVIMAICLAVILGLPEASSAELTMFQETFFTKPLGPLNGETPGAPPDTTSIGPAELGTITLVNGNTTPPSGPGAPLWNRDTSNQAVVQENASGIEGKSLLFHKVASTGNSPIFYGSVAPTPTGGTFNSGRYVIDWTAVCDSVSPTCNMGFFSLIGGGSAYNINYNNSGNFSYVFQRGQPSIDTGIPVVKGEPNRFTAIVDFGSPGNSPGYSLYIDGVSVAVAEPFMDASFTQIGSFFFEIGGTQTETYAISDIRIVRQDARDIDGDRVADGYYDGDILLLGPDNCPNDHNPDQSDYDNDGVGDSCDATPMGNLAQPIGGSAIVSTDGQVEVCVQWPATNDANSIYVVPPNCSNIQFSLQADGQPLEPNCLYPEAYNISDTNLLVPDKPYCVTCDLRERFPQLPTTDSLAAATITDITYESYITDPWIDPATGTCLSELAGVVRDGTPCRDVWIGRTTIPVKQKLTPVINWEPADIALGTALSTAQLNSTANIEGTFTYNPALGEVLSAGPHTLTATFLPNDTNLFNTVTTSRDINVQYATNGQCLGTPGHQILEPINANGTSVFKQRSAVPVKFRVCDINGNSIGTAGLVSSFKQTGVTSGTLSQAVNEDVISTSSTDGFRWSATDQQWVYNLATKGLSAGKTYDYRILLNDGSDISFRFGLK